MNTAEFNMAEQIITANRRKFSSAVNKLLDDQKLALVPHTILIRKDISNAANAVDLIDANTKLTPGVSTLDGDKLHAGVGFVGLGVAIAAVEGDETDGEGGQDYSGTTPTLVRNSTFSLKQNGREILIDPVANLVKGEATASAKDYVGDPNSMFYIIDNESFEAQLIVPYQKAITPSAAGKAVYLEMRIIGFKTKPLQ